jgi:hypothetical protein
VYSDGILQVFCRLEELEIGQMWKPHRGYITTLQSLVLMSAMDVVREVVAKGKVEGVLSRRLPTSVGSLVRTSRQQIDICRTSLADLGPISTF